MKILFNSYQAINIMKGGPKYKILQLKSSLEKLGVTIKLFNSWNNDTYDLVHLFNAHSGTYHYARSLKLDNKKYIINPIFYSKHSHYKVKSFLLAQGLLNSFINGFMSEILMTQDVCRNSEFVLPNTLEEKNMLIKGLGINANNMSIIHNGVEKRFIDASPNIFIKKYNIRNFILHVGHIGAKRKNTYNLIKAINRLDCPAVFIGNILNNKEGMKCKFLIERSNNILYLGWVKHDDVMLESAYAACHSFVLPSLYETPGRAALEAGLAGANIVITQYGGTKEYFKKFAFYCNPYSIDSIYTNLADSLNKKRSVELSKHIYSNFLWDKIAIDTLKIYNDIL